MTKEGEEHVQALILYREMQDERLQDHGDDTRA